MQSISLRELFDHIGTPRMTFSKRAEALSDEKVEVRGYLVAMHAEAKQITLSGEAGVCPDCAEKPVAYAQLPGFSPGAGLFSPQTVRLTGRLSYGFAVAPEGYATFLRLENASVATGLKPGLLSGKRN